METSSIYLWTDAIPNWIMAISALSAAILFVWRKQDRREAFEAEQASIRDGVNAVWVAAKVDSDAKPKWGVLVTNNLSAPVADLEISCSGNYRSKSLSHPNLQPGVHFFESLPSSEARSWALPTSNVASHEFITSSKSHIIHSLSFHYSGQSHTKSF